MQTRFGVPVTSCAALTMLAAVMLVGGAAQTPSTLTLDLSSERSAYLLGEIVPLTASLTNTGPQGVPLTTMPHPMFGELTLEIAGPGEPLRRYLGPGWSTVDYFAKPRTLAPKQNESATFPVLWNRPIAGAADHLDRAAAFPAAGIYRLRASLTNGGTVLRSADLILTLREPPVAERAVWTFLQQNPESLHFIQDPRTPLSAEQRDQLIRLAAAHPASVYATQINRALSAASGLKR